MATPRFFLDRSIDTGTHLVLDGDVHHHLSRVLRLDKGDTVTLFNGAGGEFQGTIDTVSKRETTLRINSFKPENRDPALQVHLGICVLKKDAMDRAIARAVEVGVTSLTPLTSDYCTVGKKVIDNRASHWEKVVIASCEQCGLNLLPGITPAVELTDWLRRAEGEKILCHPGETTLESTGYAPASVSLATGPEGGFSDAELQAAAKAGFRRVSFGERILRGETAPLVALSVIHKVWGDY